jgi:hypothetical protein
MKMTSDNLGVEFQIGDTVRVSGYGDGVRLTDCGRFATVIGFTPRGNVRIDTAAPHGDPIANGRPVRPAYLMVLRRDGQPGLEGNR